MLRACLDAEKIYITTVQLHTEEHYDFTFRRSINNSIAHHGCYGPVWMPRKSIEQLESRVTPVWMSRKTIESLYNRLNNSKITFSYSGRRGVGDGRGRRGAGGGKCESVVEIFVGDSASP